MAWCVLALALAPLTHAAAAEKAGNKPAAAKPREGSQGAQKPKQAAANKSAQAGAQRANGPKPQRATPQAAPSRQAATKPKAGPAAAQRSGTNAQARSNQRPAQTAKAGSKQRPAQGKATTRNAQAKATAGNGLRPPKRQASRPAPQQARAARPAQAPRPSYGQIFGLHAVEDELDLKSAVALVIDQETEEVLFSKNSEAVLPIASITKLMTALVVTEANLPLHEMLTVAQADVDATAGSRSRLALGTRLSRGEMLHLSLMSSENRAAHVLGRTYPGGVRAFVAAMNRKAAELGMQDTRYVEPTGLSSGNQSSAMDLAQLVRASMEHPIIRELSTAPQASIPVGARQVEFRNTNGLVYNPEWEIGLQKTGYIAAAGRCVVMQAELAGRKLIMVLLDSAGRYSRIGDAERLRKWIAETQLGEGSNAGAVARLPGFAPGTAATLINGPQLR